MFLLKRVDDEVLNGYPRVPKVGNSRLCMGDIETMGTYSSTRQHVEFGKGWPRFRLRTQFCIGDIVLVKVVVHMKYIKLIIEKVNGLGIGEGG